MSSEESDQAEVAFRPPLMLLAFVALGSTASWLVPVGFLPALWSSRAGPPVVALALALFVWAVVTMRRGGASIPCGQPTEALVAKGPYRISRNPIYLGMVLLLLGIGTWTNSVWFVALAVIAVIALTLGVIMPEERYLGSKFGESYLSYKRQVRRWI